MALPIVEKIREEVENTTVYLDFSDSADSSELSKFRTIQDYVEHIDELNVDSTHTLSLSVREEIVGNYFKDSDTVKWFIERYLEDIYPSAFINVEQLLNTEVTVVLSLTSNFDVLGSWWFLAQGEYFTVDGYLRDTIDALGINPKEFQTFLESKGYSFEVSLPDIGGRNPLVNMEELWLELSNTTSDCNLLTIRMKANLYELYQNENKGKTLKDFVKTVPKGTQIGLFDSSQGAGGLMEGTTLRDFKPSKHWSVEIEGMGSGYTYKEVYG